MSIFQQIPLYAPYLATVFKMAPKRDKENSKVQTITKSRIPISTTKQNLAAKWGREHMIAKMSNRPPLIDIQHSANGGMTNDGVKDFPNSVKKEKIVTQISPRGSVIRVVRSTTTTRLDNPHTVKIIEALKDPARFVTVRKHEDSPLDWNLKVLQASGPKYRREKSTTQIANTKKLTLQRSKSAERPIVGGLVPKPLTPTQVPIAQHNRVKNVKRSLKRPSSKELQNRSCQTESKTDLAPLMQLDLGLKVKCGKHYVDNPNSIDTSTRHLTICYERYIIRYLLVCGQNVQSVPNFCPIQRGIVVNWLVRLNSAQTPDSGAPQVLQTAVRYLDRILAIDTIPTDKVQLFAAVCYWLAQKQCAKPRSATSIARHSAEAFCALDMKATERYIIKKMSWPTIPIVADDFVPYLVLVCSPSQPDLLNTAATFLCTVALLDMENSTCTPDVIAVAAVVNCILHLDVGTIRNLEENIVYRKASSNFRFGEVRTQMLRKVQIMREETCPCREPYVQYSKPPLKVSVRLAEALLAKGQCIDRRLT